MARRVEVDFIGPFQLRVGGVEVQTDAFARPTARHLVQFLALAPARQRHQEQIMDALWPDLDVEAAKRRLYKATSLARSALGDRNSIVVANGVLTLFPDDDVVLDLEQVARVDLADADAVAAALDRFRGELLPELLYAEWTVDARTACADRHRELLRAAGRWRRLVELDPTDEDAHVALMRDAIAHGDRTGALRRFETLSDVLSVELGVEPGAEAIALRDAAEALEGADTAPTPAPAASLGRRAVPAPHTVGRTEEMKEIADTLERHRLVTLVGPGGAGKTHLAIETAAGLADVFEHGVWVAELGTVADPGAVDGELLAALGGVRHSDTDDLGSLARRIGVEPTLLVIDNCEHQLDAVRSATSALLDACPMLRVLATSRAPLTVAGEIVVPAGPLARRDAIELFEAEVRRRGGTTTIDDEDSVDRICARLEDLPLAIRFAAARARRLGALAVERLLDDQLDLLGGDDAVDDDLPHHRTLRQAIAWSFDALSSRQRGVLCDLSTFANRFDADGAVAVATRDGMSAGEVLDHLDALLRDSLVLGPLPGIEQPRYRLLESVRLFARSVATEDEAAGAADRHATHVSVCAERASAALPTDDMAVERLQGLWDDARVAWRHATDADRSDDAIELLAALAPIAIIWMRFEYADWCKETFAPLVDVESGTPTAGLGPDAAGPLAMWATMRGARGDFESAVRLARLAHELDEDNDVALYSLGWLAMFTEPDDRGGRWFERLVEDRTGTAGTVRGGAMTQLVTIDQGGGERAERCLAHLDALATRGTRPYRANAQMARGVRAMFHGNSDEAMRCFAAARDIADSYGNLFQQSGARNGLAGTWLLFTSGDERLRAIRESLVWPLDRGIWPFSVGPLRYAATALSEAGDHRSAVIAMTAATHSDFSVGTDFLQSRVMGAAAEANPDEVDAWSGIGSELSIHEALALTLATLDELIASNAVRTTSS